MIVGIALLTAACHKTLSTGVRPFEAMRRFVDPALAWGGRFATVASI